MRKATSKKATRIAAAALACACAVGSSACAISKTPDNSADEFTVTVFSDVHHGDNNYNDFNCTRAFEKLGKIIDETQDSEFYINLGDMCDYLKGGKITFYDEVADFVHGRDIDFYHPEGKNYTEGRRLMYNLMGNHETAYVPKSDLKEYVPYVNNVGSVYSFSYKNVLFLCVDANFDRETQSDECSVMRTSTKFILPEKVLSWLKTEAAAKIDQSTKGIVWLSHIAFKDIENTSRFALMDYLATFNLPLTIFEGHTHYEIFDQWYDEDDPTKLISTIYTLPAVTSGLTYKYYNVTFKDGRVENIDKHADSIDEIAD